MLYNIDSRQATTKTKKRRKRQKMLKRITQDELKECLRKHQLWVYGEDGGERADLSEVNLSDANLRGADLSCANLKGANLSCANLRGADLGRANLDDANLSYADLSCANLRGADLSDTDLINVDLINVDLSEANLSCADLRGANLRCANLGYANLSYANLSCASLKGANLGDANLSCANLRGADLSDANLSDANLRSVKYNDLTAFYALACPEVGAFIGWKTACGKIVKLEICEDAKRSSSTSRKCRCSKAKVLAIENMDGSDSGLSVISSDHDSSFVYTVGETVEVSDYDDNRWNECSAGIHFFITRDEAVRWG
jgi:uncharacterized protein YjbI with pentapeptide repeats